MTIFPLQPKQHLPTLEADRAGRKFPAYFQLDFSTSCNQDLWEATFVKGIHWELRHLVLKPKDLISHQLSNLS